MTVEEKEKERCKWCGKLFKKLALHTPHCEVYKLQQEADQNIQNLEIKPKGGIQEIDVPESSTAKIIPDRFWSWTEGLGIQMGVVIGHLSDVRDCCGNMMKLLREQLYALNSGMADQIELLKEIVEYNKKACESYEEVKKQVSEANALPEPTLMTGPSPLEVKTEAPKATFKKVESPKPQQSQQDADFEAYEEMQRKEGEVKTYKEEITLPEGTRQLTGAVTITTEKAFEILFANGKQVWIPKSTVHSTTKEGGENQTFVIDSWVLKKNGVIGEDD